MSLYGLLTTSASGMSAQSTLLGTVADNIANVDTVGYKSGSAEFASMVLGASNSNFQSGSVLAAPRITVEGQGPITSTSSPTDLAVQGVGFFLVQGPGGTPVLTRAGSFVENSSGNLVNSAGYTLLGYPAGTTGVSNGYGGLTPVNLSTLGLQASPTTSGELYLNLPSASASLSASTTLPSTNPATGATYTEKTSLSAYDNLGNQITLDVYLSNVSTAGNPPSWEVDVFDASTATNGGFPYTSGPLTTQTLTFDPTTGALTSGSPISIAIPNGKTMSLDMSQSTQLATSYTILQASTNGNAPSQVSNISIGTDGTLSTVYQNGATIQQYKIPLATVVSPDSMTAVTGNAYEPNTSSGAAQIGKAGLGGVGKIASNALESSTVDLSTELTKMIAAQNNYQANSKVFQTGSQLLQVLISIEH